MAKKPSKHPVEEMDMEEAEAGTQSVMQRRTKNMTGLTMTPEQAAVVKQYEEEEAARAAASEEYEEKMAEAQVESEPPPEAAAHEGLAPYRLLEDANIKHQDQVAGDVLALTHEEYQSLRAVNVHCEQVAVPKV